MANISQGDQTLLMAPEKKQPNKPRNDSRDSLEPRNNRGRTRERAPRAERTERGNRPERSAGGSRNADLELFRIEVGREHGVEPSNIVGAIANEAGLDARNIGQISINDNHSLVELPMGMPKDVFGELRKVWVCGQQLRISRDGEAPNGPVKDGRPPRSESKPKRRGPQGDDFKSEKKRAPRSKANSAEARPGSTEPKKKPAKRAPKPVESDS